MPETEDKFERTSTIAVARGLHAFRYVSFQNGASPALAKVSATAALGRGLEIVSMPGRPPGVLSKPGDCVVVRAESAGEILVGLKRGAPEGSLEASFRLEPLALADDAPASVVADQATRPVGGLFIAHVANLGDVTIAENQWAGGPDSPGVIEGLEILDGAARLEMQALVGSRPPRWTGWVKAGEFAGTRGRRTPVSGIRLKLQADAPADVQIEAEALFLGSLVTSKTGREVEFVSASGVDPLVGLKLSLARVQPGVGGKGGEPVAPLRDREPKVRVFRASGAR